MNSEFGEFRSDIANLVQQLDIFQVEFMNKYDFKKFADNLNGNLNVWNEICITGYFAETIREQLVRLAWHKKVKLICPKFEAETKRDKQNLEVLRKLSKAGVEIKVNDRMHARLLVAHNPESYQLRGLLIIGSFDFNADCLALQRYDAGIKTGHPDLIESALKLFEEIWNDSSSQTLEKAFKK